MSSVNKVMLVDDYRRGMSLPQVSSKQGVPISTARAYVKAAKALRSRADGVRAAAADGRVGVKLIGRKRTFSPQHKQALSQARLEWGEKNAVGISVKKNGYAEFTRGPHKGRFVHVVVMEQRIGRRLLPDECVHHIDGNGLNNDISNLALVTISAHSRLHRREEMLLGKHRERDENGRFR